MTPERQAAIRAALEQADPALYRPGNFSARHDYDVKWELLLALEAAQERFATAEGLLTEVRGLVPEYNDEMGDCYGGCGLDWSNHQPHKPTCLWSRIDAALSKP